MHCGCRAGSGPTRVGAVKAVVDAGVAVMGHVGLTPQSISVLGGFRPQGRSADSAMQIIRDAKVSHPPPEPLGSTKKLSPPTGCCPIF